MTKHYMVKKGAITTIQHKKLFEDYLQSLPDGGYEIIVQKAKKTRSGEQNRLYWEWLTIVGEDLGHHKDEMHFVFKRQFLCDKMPVLQRDEFMEYLQGLGKNLQSTRKLTTKEMTEYLDKVFEQARDLNINLPLPEVTNEKP